MGKVNPGSLKDWRDGDVVMAADYKQERELLRVAINDNFDRLIKQVVVQNANGQTKSTANLDEALNILHFKEGANVTLSLDPATATLTIAVTYENSSVGTAAIADGAVTTVKVANSAINTIKIANNAVTEPKIANNAVSTRTIQNGSVTEPKMSDNSISTRTIQSKAVTEGKLNDAAVTTRTIADRAVNTAKLADRSVTEAKIQVGALDNRYYTEAEVDAKLANKTDKTGDHQGTWHGLRVEDIDPEGFDAARITALEKRLDDEEVRDFTISNRLSVVHTDQATSLHITKLEGRTVVNHLPLFDSGLWAIAANHTVLSATELEVEGNTTTPPQGQTAFTLKRVKPNTTYTLSVDKDDGVRVNFTPRDASNNILSYNPIDGTARSMTITTPSNVDNIAISIDANLRLGTFRVRNVILVEHSQPQEFVVGMKNLSGFYMKRYGKNLIPPFNEWDSINSLANVIEPYKLELTSDAPFTNPSEVIIPCLPNQTYSRNIVISRVGESYMQVSTLDAEGNVLTANTLQTFTTESNATHLRIRVYKNQAATGTFIWENPVLNLGSEPIPFEPQNSDYLFADVELASNANAKDVLEYRDGRYWKVKRFNKIVLDGSYEWRRTGTLSGWRIIAVPKANGVALDRLYGEFPNVVRYDGLRLIPGALSADGANVVGAGVWNNPDNPIDSFAITVADADSGWISGVEPNANAVKALMNGWRATNHNGTRYTYWAPILSSGSVVNDENYVANNKAPGWTGWAMLQYQLADSVVEDVTDKVEGAISLYEGDNQVEMGEAVVVREDATPSQSSTGEFWIINDTSSLHAASALRYPVEDFVAVYRNGQQDSSWEKFTGTNTNGKWKLRILSNLYDPSASYSVTYIAEPYQYSANAQSVDVQYTANVKTALDRTIQDVADLSTRVSAVPSIYARKGQEPWIEPTLLNGWSGVARYYKDEFGTVHATCSISGGIATSGTVLFVLPEGYRPDISPSRTFVAYTTTSAPTPDIAFVDVHTDGRVRIASSEFKNPTFAFSISFRAK